jgi:hypothetical protein
MRESRVAFVEPHAKLADALGVFFGHGRVQVSLYLQFHQAAHQWEGEQAQVLEQLLISFAQRAIGHARAEQNQMLDLRESPLDERLRDEPAERAAEDDGPSDVLAVENGAQGIGDFFEPRDVGDRRRDSSILVGQGVAQPLHRLGPAHSAVQHQKRPLTTPARDVLPLDAFDSDAFFRHLVQTTRTRARAKLPQYSISVSSVSAEKGRGRDVCIRGRMVVGYRQLNWKQNPACLRRRFVREREARGRTLCES